MVNLQGMGCKELRYNWLQVYSGKTTSPLEVVYGSSSREIVRSRHKYQWDLIHDPESMIAFFQDEEEGEMTFNPINKKYTKLFDHVFKNNRINNLSYITLVNTAAKTGIDKEVVDLAYEDNEAKKWSKEEKTWIDSWKVRVMNSEDVFTNVIQAVQDASPNGKIGKIILRPKHIYFGKYKIGDRIYPVAIYGDGEGVVMDDVFTKVQVTDTDMLSDKDLIKHVYCDETHISYLIVAFYEKDAEEPSMIMQVEKFIGDNSKEKWLEYLGIYRAPIDGKTMEEIFSEYETLTVEEISEVRDKIEALKDITKKKELFLELQGKVPYHNQLNNDQTQYIANRMCNLTSEAMCL